MVPIAHRWRAGPLAATLKPVARRVLQWHLPCGGVARPVLRACYAGHVAARELSAWAARFLWYEPLLRAQCERVGTRLHMERLPYLVGRGRILLGDHVRLSGKSSLLFLNRPGDLPELDIGNDTFVGHDCTFSIAQRVSIGRRCLIAGGVRVSDHDGHPLEADRRYAGEPPDRESIRPVTLGDDVWVGAGAVIVKGVSVGDRSVIGTRAVVTKDVPPDVVVAGNPARVVKCLAPVA